MGHRKEGGGSSSDVSMLVRPALTEGSPRSHLLLLFIVASPSRTQRARGHRGFAVGPRAIGVG